MFCFLTLKVQTFNLKKPLHHIQNMFSKFFKEIASNYMISHVDVLVVPLLNLLTLIFLKSQLKFKEAVSRDGFGCWWYIILILGLNTVEDGAIISLGAPIIFNAKSVYLAGNANLHWLHNVSCLILSFQLITSNCALIKIDWLDACIALIRSG